jgi:hypothetical protein
MRNKLFLLLCGTAVLLFTLGAFAEDTANQRWRQSNPRTDKDVTPPAPTQGQSGLATSSESATTLDPSLQAINATYAERMQAIMAAFGSATTETEKVTAQQQAQDLKVQWSLAAAFGQLDLARNRKDAQAEAEILRDIDNLQHPPATVNHLAVRPESDKAVQGDAK